MPDSLFIVIESLLKGIVFIIYLLTTAALTVWLERRVAAFAQDRLGPNRTGPFGLLQPFADVFKLFFKEDIVPRDADKFVHSVAPIISVSVAILLYTVVPLAHYIEIGDRVIYFGIAPNINVAILFILAMTSVGVYSFTLAGWASSNKYSMLGALRSSAQMISYEIAMGMAIVSVVMVCGSLGTNDIILQQTGWKWHIFLQPVGFLIYFIAALAEINRTPFDFPEAEQELVAGYNTEYSSMRFGMFFLAEYSNVATSSIIMVILFLGGWQLPFVDWNDGSILTALLQTMVTIGKVAILVFIIVWIRWSIPRFRYDQLMRLGWHILLPLAILNLVVTAIVIYFM